MSHSEEEYSDILGEHPDIEAIRIARGLKRSYRASLAPERDRAIERVLASRAERSGAIVPAQCRRITWVRRPLPIIATSFVLLALVVGSVYGASAAGSLINQALSSSPASTQIAGLDLGQAVNMPTSRCGFTLTISRVYADPLRVIIGYSIRGPEGRTFFGGVNGPGTAPVLSDSQGHTFPQVEGIPAPGPHGSETGDVLAFAAIGFAQQRGLLRLHLRLPAIQLNERYDHPAPAAASCEQDSTGARAQGHWWRLVTIAGPFTFALRIPVLNDIRTAALHRVAEAQGVTVTLERAAISPSEVQIYTRDSLPRSSLAPVAELAGPGIPRTASSIAAMLTTRHDGKTFWLGAYVGAHHGLREYNFNTSGYAYHGQWTLAMYPQGSEGTGQGIGNQHAVIFHFITP